MELRGRSFDHTRRAFVPYGRGPRTLLVPAGQLQPRLQRLIHLQQPLGFSASASDAARRTTARGREPRPAHEAGRLWLVFPGQLERYPIPDTELGTAP